MKTYAFRVDGHLDPHWCTRLGALRLTHHEDGTTTLVSAIADQAQLYGLLIGLRDIGATLLSVLPVDGDCHRVGESGTAIDWV